MMANFVNATFDSEINTFEDWGLMCESVSIPLPSPKIITQDIPGSDGKLDLSEALTGGVAYENRTISIVTSLIGEIDDWVELTSRIANYLHGKNRQIVFDFDPAHYYYGRFTIDSAQTDEATNTVVITGDCDPYKYNVELSEIALAVSGSVTQTIYGSRMGVIPIISSDAAMTVTFEEAVYTLAIGDNEITDIYLIDGENTLLFTGIGNITITYREGSF